jgi:hypothetical protein
MPDEKILTLGTIQNQPVHLLSSGRFAAAGDHPLPGTWLAAYTPLDGAFLITTDPPVGFLGISEAEMLVHTGQASAHITLPNLAALECSLSINPINQSRGLPAAIKIQATNRTANPLPVSFAFSWQDLNHQTPRPAPQDQHGLKLLFSDNLSIGVEADQPKVRDTWCCGWDPAGNGAEIWDDYFISGELGNQTYASFGGVLACYYLLPARQSISLNFSIIQSIN